MLQFYIANPGKIQGKLSTMQEIDVFGESPIRYYLDAENNQWILEENRETMVLKRLPQPSVGELVDIVISTDDMFVVLAASQELAERESKNGEEFRGELIDKLESINLKSLGDFDRQRIKNIIYETELYFARNRREVLGKQVAEIKKDAAMYREIARKAVTILLEL